MDYKLCKKCNSYHYNTTKCDPKFSVWYHDFLFEDGVIIHAKSAAIAAERYCQLHDEQGDYDIIENGEATVMVRDEAGNITVYEINAYPLPTYDAMRHDDEAGIIERAKKEMEEDEASGRVNHHPKNKNAKSKAVLPW